MEQSIRVASKRKLRKSEGKAQEEKSLSIIKAFYLGNHTLLLSFNNGVQKKLDFLPLFQQYLKEDYLQYVQLSRFKKFIVANGNIYWGKNEDVIFPVSFLYNHPKSRIEKEEVLYVI